MPGNRRSRVAIACAVAALSVAAILAFGGKESDDDRPTAQTTTATAQPAGPAEDRGNGNGGGPPEDRGRGGGGAPAEESVASAPPAKRPREKANLDGVASPTRIESDGKEAARAVEAELGVAEGEDPTVIGSTCRNGRCTVRFRAVPRGVGRNLGDQAPIIRRLFVEPSVRSVQFYVHHKRSGRGHDERAAFMAVSCRRTAIPEPRLRKLDGGDIDRFCAVRKASGGKQRSLISRGKLSVEDASRARDR